MVNFILAIIGLVFGLVGVLGKGKMPLGLAGIGILLLAFIPSLFINLPWYVWAVGILVIIISLLQNK